MQSDRKRFQLWFPFTPSLIGIEEDDIPKTHNRTFSAVLAKITNEFQWKCEQAYLTNKKHTYTLDGEVHYQFFPVSFRKHSSSHSGGRQWSLSALAHVFFKPPDLLAIFQAYGLFAKALAFVARMRRVPYIVIVGGWYSQISRTQRWYFDHAFYVLVHTQMQKQALMDIGYKGANIEIFPLGIDVNQFSQKPFKNYEMCNRDWPRFLYVGRLQPSKGPFETLLTFAAIKQHYPNATLKIVGPCNDQPFLAHMKRFVEKNALQEAVSFEGPVAYEMLPNYYQNADIFLFPSPYEGLPSVVLESMACGTPPVVMRGSGGTEEAVLHGETGWVVDMSRLAYDVLEILAKPDNIQAIGEQAASRTQEVYSSLRTFNILTSVMAKISND